MANQGRRVRFRKRGIPIPAGDVRFDAEDAPEHYEVDGDRLDDHRAGIDDALGVTSEAIEVSAEQYVNRLNDIIFILECATGVDAPGFDGPFGELDDIIFILKAATGVDLA